MRASSCSRENDTQTPVEQAMLLQQKLTEINHPDHVLITYPNEQVNGNLGRPRVILESSDTICSGAVTEKAKIKYTPNF